MENIELLAPAGSLEKIKYALIIHPFHLQQRVYRI